MSTSGLITCVVKGLDASMILKAAVLQNILKSLVITISKYHF